MFNSIQFFSGLNTWVTQDECDSLSAKLLNGDKFVKLDRLQKTYNTSDIANIGVNGIFADPLVSGGEFSFSYDGLWAKKDGNEYRWNKGWKVARGEFSQGIPFDDFIQSLTIK